MSFKPRITCLSMTSSLDFVLNKVACCLFPQLDPTSIASLKPGATMEPPAGPPTRLTKALTNDCGFDMVCRDSSSSPPSRHLHSYLHKITHLFTSSRNHSDENSLRTR